MLIDMAREGFNTGFEDENGNPILVGDQSASGKSSGTCATARMTACCRILQKSTDSISRLPLGGRLFLFSCDIVRTAYDETVR